MAPYKSLQKKFQARFERASHFQNLVYTAILHNQQTDLTDANGELADTLLICDGGTIRTHAFLLQAASPFIHDAMASQGENYPYVREILIPDFSVKEIEKILSLIYMGYVDLRSDKEVQDLQETLKFFKISSVDFSNAKTDKIKGSLKIQERNRIPQNIFKIDAKKKVIGLSSTDLKPHVAVSVASVDRQKTDHSKPENSVRRSGRSPKPIVQIGKDEGAAEAKSDDSDYQENSEDESSVEEGSKDKKQTKSRVQQPMNKLQPVVKLPRIIAPKSNSVSLTSANVDAKSKSNTEVTVVNDPKTDQDGSDTDPEDQGWVTPDYKNKEWFNRESCRCQTCKKSFKKPAEASLCITGHKSLRCYFCFRVYSTTDILFDHFRKRHKPAGRESTLICPYCDQAVPYKSVSCHVISVHLKSMPTNDNQPGGTRTLATGSSTIKYNNVRMGPGRPPTTPTMVATSSGHSSRRRSRSRSVSTERVFNSSERNPPKKLKTTKKANQNKKSKVKMPKDNRERESDRELKVRNLDVTLRKITSFGRTITFRLQKKRLGGDIDAT